MALALPRVLRSAGHMAEGRDRRRREGGTARRRVGRGGLRPRAFADRALARAGLVRAPPKPENPTFDDAAAMSVGLAAPRLGNPTFIRAPAMSAGFTTHRHGNPTFARATAMSGGSTTRRQPAAAGLSRPRGVPLSRRPARPPSGPPALPPRVSSVRRAGQRPAGAPVAATVGVSPFTSMFSHSAVRLTMGACSSVVAMWLWGESIMGTASLGPWMRL